MIYMYIEGVLCRERVLERIITSVKRIFVSALRIFKF